MTTRPPGFISRICFHVACTVVLLTGIAHAIAQLMGDAPPKTDQERKLVDAIALRLPEPVNRSLGEILAGFGHHYSISLVLFAVFGWVVLRWAKRDPSLYRALCGLLTVASLIFTANSFIHFFIIPNAFHVVASVFFIAAFALAPKSLAQEPIR